jgi:hypothetical protein
MDNQIPLFRLIVLRQALKLEILGMHRSKGRSAYTILKQELGLKGNKTVVLDQVDKLIFKAKQLVLPIESDNGQSQGSNKA